MGDSLSAEYGIKRGAGWVQLLDQRLAERKLPWSVVNASVSGETSSGGARRLPALLHEHQPRLVIIELGANDGLRGLPIQSMRDNLRGMIAAAHQAQARVVLVGMRIPPNYGRDYSTGFASSFEELSKETKSPLVPFLFEGIAERLELFQADHLHPTAQAQDRLLENVWPALAPLLRIPPR